MCKNGVMCDEKRQELTWLAYELMKSLLFEMNEFGDLEGWDTEDIFALIKRIEVNETEAK